MLQTEVVHVAKTAMRRWPLTAINRTRRRLGGRTLTQLCQALGIVPKHAHVVGVAETVSLDSFLAPIDIAVTDRFRHNASSFIGVKYSTGTVR